MWPTIAPGRSVLVDPRAFRRAGPTPGDIVLLQHPSRPDLLLVKRVTRVGTQELVVQGDNPEDSTDSRHYGPVPIAAVLGRVECLFGSPAPSPDSTVP